MRNLGRAAQKRGSARASILGLFRKFLPYRSSLRGTSRAKKFTRKPALRFNLVGSLCRSIGHQACGGLANWGAQRRSVVLLAQVFWDCFVNFFHIEAPCGANHGQRNLRGNLLYVLTWLALFAVPSVIKRAVAWQIGAPTAEINSAQGK